ncbi:MAG: hypothetical protein RR053_08105, partial [Evtepia sp.]
SIQEIAHTRTDDLSSSNRPPQSLIPRTALILTLIGISLASALSASHFTRRSDTVKNTTIFKLLSSIEKFFRK